MMNLEILIDAQHVLFQKLLAKNIWENIRKRSLKFWIFGTLMNTVMQFLEALFYVFKDMYKTRLEFYCKFVK